MGETYLDFLLGLLVHFLGLTVVLACIRQVFSLFAVAVLVELVPAVPPLVPDLAGCIVVDVGIVSVILFRNCKGRPDQFFRSELKVHNKYRLTLVALVETPVVVQEDPGAEAVDGVVGGLALEEELDLGHALPLVVVLAVAAAGSHPGDDRGRIGHRCGLGPVGGQGIGGRVHLISLRAVRYMRLSLEHLGLQVNVILNSLNP